MKRKAKRTVLPAKIEWRNKDGKLHCENGPALEVPFTGGKYWYRNGRPEGGPAADGPHGKRWYRTARRIGKMAQASKVPTGCANGIGTASGTGTMVPLGTPV
jgi:hypothetical protein